MSDKKVKFTRKDGKKVAFNGTKRYVKKAEKKIADAHADQVQVQVTTEADGTTVSQRSARPAGNNEEDAQQFPTAFLSAAEEKDLMMQTRMAIGNRLGEQQFKTEDAQWLLRKVQAAKDANFQAWFAKNFDKTGVTAKAWARDVFPEFYEQRMKTLDINLDTLRKLARIKIRGLETPEDVALQYAADKGLLPLEQLQNLLNPNLGGADAQASRFERGLFNINTYLENVGSIDQYNRERFYGSNAPDGAGVIYTGDTSSNPDNLRAKEALRFLA